MACNLTTGEVEYIDKTIADLKAENAKLVMKLNAEHLVRQNVERENAKLRELCHDMLAVIIGWSWKFNELAGYRLDDEDTYPSRVMRGFIDRARELEVPL